MFLTQSPRFVEILRNVLLWIRHWQGCIHPTLILIHIRFFIPRTILKMSASHVVLIVIIYITFISANCYIPKSEWEVTWSVVNYKVIRCHGLTDINVEPKLIQFDFKMVAVTDGVSFSQEYLVYSLGSITFKQFVGFRFWL